MLPTALLRLLRNLRLLRLLLLALRLLLRRELLLDLRLLVRLRLRRVRGRLVRLLLDNLQPLVEVGPRGRRLRRLLRRSLRKGRPLWRRRLLVQRVLELLDELMRRVDLLLALRDLHRLLRDAQAQAIRQVGRVVDILALALQRAVLLCEVVLHLDHVVHRHLQQGLRVLDLTKRVELLRARVLAVVLDHLALQAVNLAVVVVDLDLERLNLRRALLDGLRLSCALLTIDLHRRLLRVANLELLDAQGRLAAHLELDVDLLAQGLLLEDGRQLAL